MESLVALVKTFVPGSTAFLLLAITTGVGLLYVPRAAAWARRWLVAVVTAYVALATPALSDLLQNGLHPEYPRIDKPADAGGATAIVVLGNGAVTYVHPAGELHALTRRTSMNVLEGLRLYRLLTGSRLIVSGGVPPAGANRRPEADLMAEALAGLGVPPSDVLIESRSQNTEEQGVRVAALLAPNERVVLVTTPIHMRRALGYFAGAGLQPVPSPTPIEYGPESRSWTRRLVPNTGALRASELTIYEWLGLGLRWTRGWMADADADTPP